MRRRWLVLALMLATAAALVWAIFRGVDVDGVLAALRGASVPALALLVVFSTAIWLVMPTLRWSAVLQVLGVSVSFRQLLRVRVGAQPLKLVVPLRGGEAVRALWLRKRAGTPLAVGLASIVFDMGLVALGQLGLATVALAAVTVGGGPPAALVVASGMLVLAAVGLGSSSAQALGLRLVGAASGRLADRLRPVVTAVAACTALSKARLVALTLATELPEIVSLWAAFQVVGADISLVAVAKGLPFVIAAGLLPISVGGFGTREYAITAVFAGLASPEALVAGALVFSAVEFALPAVLGLVATASVLADLAAEDEQRAG